MGGFHAHPDLAVVAIVVQRQSGGVAGCPRGHQRAAITMIFWTCAAIAPNCAVGGGGEGNRGGADHLGGAGLAARDLVAGRHRFARTGRQDEPLFVSLHRPEQLRYLLLRAGDERSREFRYRQRGTP